MFQDNLFLSSSYKRTSELAQIKRATSALMNLTLNIFWIITLTVNPVLYIVRGMGAGNKNHLPKGQVLPMSDGGSTFLSQKVPYAALLKR